MPDTAPRTPGGVGARTAYTCRARESSPADAMPGQPLIRATDLKAERDGRVLFSGLAVEVTAGEVVRVEGPNGAGKTTLLRILAGLDQDFEGSIDHPVSRLAGRPWRCDCLFLGHLPGLKAMLTPRENLAWLARLREQPVTVAAIDAALAKVGLPGYEDVPVSTLSAGQKRRVALSRLFLERAPLWILDEPFTAIDRAGVADLETTLADHARAGGAILFTTHHEPALSVRALSLGRARRAT